MSQETRRRISASKMGRSHSENTRRKMSASHTGKTLSSESMQKISQKLSGVPKTEIHKDNISLAQKCRHKAIRALRNIEAIHKEQNPGATRSIPSACLVPSLSEAAGCSGREQTRAEVLNSYKAQLREYRAIQQELTPWMTAFREHHGRKPTMEDVEATQITWLVEKHKDYILLRQKLLADIPILRTKLEAAQADSINTIWPSTTGEDVGGHAGKQHTPGKDAGLGIAERIALARVYRRERPLNKRGKVGTGASGDLNPSTSSIADNPKPLTSLPVNAPKRVREAMLAAMQYRHEKGKAVGKKDRASNPKSSSGTAPGEGLIAMSNGTGHFDEHIEDGLQQVATPAREPDKTD